MPGMWLLPAALASKFELLDVLDKDRNLLTSGCDVTGAACILPCLLKGHFVLDIALAASLLLRPGYACLSRQQKSERAAASKTPATHPSTAPATDCKLLSHYRRTA